MMEASLNSWTVVFLVGAAQGLFQSALIFFGKKGDRISNQLLSGVVLGFSLILLYCVAYWTNYAAFLPQFISFSLNMTYIIGPLMWLYARRQRGLGATSNILVHFVPFFFHIMTAIAVRVWFVDYVRMVSFGLVVLQNVHLLIYAGLIFKLLNNESNKSWHRNISLAYLGYALSFFSYYVMSWTGVLKIEYDYMVSLVMMTFIYFVGYHSYMHQETKQTIGKKYNKSSLTTQASILVFKRLQEYFDQQKPYVHNELTLKKLSEDLDLSTHVISQVVNEHTGSNFPDFINGYRVKYSVDLMAQPEYENEKLISIAFDSGFNNKVSFINAFKKAKGVTPNEYRTQLFDRAAFQ